MDCPVCRRPDQPATCMPCVSKCLAPVSAIHQRTQYLTSLRNRAAALLASQSNPHSSETPSLEHLQLDIAECSARVRALAATKEHVEQRIAHRQHQLVQRRQRLAAKRHALETAANRAHAFKQRANQHMEKNLAACRTSLQRAHESIMDAWKILVPELFQVFGVEPVADGGPATHSGTSSRNKSPGSGPSMEPAWTIVGLKVPLDMDVRGAPQDQLNAALGYTAHLTAILGMYLNIPLPFDLQLRMSATTADLHFRPDRDSLRPFAVPLSSSQPSSPPASLSSSISRSLTAARHRATAKPESPASRRARTVPDNLLPIHVGHAEGAERTALGLTMLGHQVTTLAARCGVKVPTRAPASAGRRRKLAPLDLVGLLAAVADVVVKDGGPLAAAAASPHASPPLGSRRGASPLSGSLVASGGVRAVSFRTILHQITRKMYKDESESGFRIVRPMFEDVAKTGGVTRRPPGANGLDLPMSETGVLVPRTPPPSIQVGSEASGGQEDEDDEGELDSDEEDDGSDDDDDDDDDDDMDPDKTISATRLEAAREGVAHASFVAIDPASVMVQSIGLEAAGGPAAASGVLDMSSRSLGSGRVGGDSKSKARRRGAGKSSAMARSIMVRSVLAAADGPRPASAASHSMFMRQSMLSVEHVASPAASLVLPPQGHIRHPIAPGMSEVVVENVGQGQSQQSGNNVSREQDDEEWEELDKTITLAMPSHGSSQGGDLLNEYAPPMTASVALLAPTASPAHHPLPSLGIDSNADHDDDDLELIESPSTMPVSIDASCDSSSSSTSSASSSRVLLSSVWNIGRRALATSYHLAVTAASAGIVSGPTVASAAMADAGNGLVVSSSSNAMPSMARSTGQVPRPRHRGQPIMERRPGSRSATLPSVQPPSSQAYTVPSTNLATSRPLVGRNTSSSRPPSGAPKKRSSGGGSSALTRSVL